MLYLIGLGPGASLALSTMSQTIYLWSLPVYFSKRVFLKSLPEELLQKVRSMTEPPPALLKVCRFWILPHRLLHLACAQTAGE